MATIKNPDWFWGIGFPSICKHCINVFALLIANKVDIMETVFADGSTLTSTMSTSVKRKNNFFQGDAIIV